MKEGTALSAPQRKALVDLLQDGYTDNVFTRAKKKYNGVRSSLESQHIQNLAKEQGADKLLAEVNQLKSKLKKAEEELSTSGFSVDKGGTFALSCDAPDSWSEDMDEALDTELGTSEEILRPFEIARVKLWTVATAEEADKIVEPLLSFEVSVK